MTRCYRNRVLTAAALTGLAFISVPGQALADPYVGANLEWAAPADDDAIDGGPGAMLRFGTRADLAVVALSGEIAVAAHSLSGDHAPNVYRGLVGGRLAVGALLRPLIFAHAGIGRVTAGESEPSVNLDRSAFTYDVGLGIDFMLLPLVNVGVYGAYTAINGNSDVDALGWYSGGLNVELVF